MLDNLMTAAKADRRSVPQDMQFNTLIAADGVQVRYAYWPQSKAARGTVLFLPGRTEFIEKFMEDMRILHGLGFAVGGMDLRGQGLSQRPYGDINKHELQSFDPHLTDVRAVRDQLEKLGAPAPFIVMAHSAGSHVTLRTLHDHGDVFAGAVTVAPMCRIDPGNFPAFAVSLLPKLMTAIGLGGLYVPGHTAVRDGLWGWRKQLTHDLDRFEDEDYFIAERAAGLAVGGATYRWLAAAARSCEHLMSPGYVEAITPKVLVLKASDDTIVDNKAVDEVAARLPSGRLVTIEGAMHEILKETDNVRQKAWAAIKPFLDELAPEG